MTITAILRSLGLTKIEKKLQISRWRAMRQVFCSSHDAKNALPCISWPQMETSLLLFLLGCFQDCKYWSSSDPSDPPRSCTQLFSFLLWNNELPWEVIPCLCGIGLCFWSCALIFVSSPVMMTAVDISELVIWQNKHLMRQLRSWTHWVKSHTKIALWSCNYWGTISLSGHLICQKMEVTERRKEWPVFYPPYMEHAKH